MRQKPTPTQSALILLLLTLILFGRVLIPPEGQALGTHDMRGLFYPWYELLRNSIFTGRLPWWDPGLFAGYPFLSNPQVAVFYPLTWLAVLPPIRIGISLYAVAHLWLGGMGIFWLVRDTAVDTAADTGRPPAWGPLLAALTFMFSGFFTARLLAGHIGLIAVHAWVPWILWASTRSVRRGDVRTAVLAGIPFGLAVLAGHTTSLLYVGLLWAAWAAYLAWGDGFDLARTWLVTRQILIAGGVGLLLAAVQLLPLAQFTQLAARTAEADYAFATGFSFPPAHLITLLVPEFFGEPTRAGYWSVPNFEELAAYAGVLPLLALLFTLKRPRRDTVFWTAVLVGGILLAFGSYGFLYRIFYDWLPPFRLARAPGRAMFFYVLAGSMLVGLGVSRWRTRPISRNWGIGTAVLGGLIGLSAIAATGAVFAAQHPTDTSGRLWHQLGGWALATGLFVTAAVLLVRFRPRASRLVPVTLVVLVVADLWLLGWKFITPTPMTPNPFWFAARDLIAQHEADPAEPGRVLPWGVSIFSQNGAMQVGLESVFGYNALEVGANAQLAASVPDPRSAAYDILGARYAIATAPLDAFTDGEAGLQLIGQADGAWVYARRRFLPLVRLVGDAAVIADEAAAIERIHQPEFDPAQTAVLSTAPACDLPGGPVTGRAEIVERSPGRWRITTHSDTAALLVVSETAYPGWTVTVDGRPADWHTAYTAVRAVCVPPGDHTVEWVFRPTIYKYGGGLSFVGMLLVGWAWRRRQ